MRPTLSQLTSRTRCLVAALALVPALIKLLCYPHNIGSDDAYIHLRIATNFVHGLGWGINPHEPVNLSTSPAFTLLLAAAEKLTAHGVGLTQLISAAAVLLGLLLIFLAALAETASVRGALFAEAAAAFSVNLWRWNGALMEATFAFAAVAAILYLFRSGARSRTPGRLVAGLVLGLGMLLRPEMGLLVVLALALQWMRSAPRERVRHTAITLVGALAVLVPWCAFAWAEMHSVIPTTFAAKSTRHLTLWNGVILRQFAESIVESLLFPCVLVLVLLVATRATRGRLGSNQWNRAGAPPDAWQSYLIPAGWVVGLIGFYYLKTPGLQSTGRYVLPLLPCEAMLLALLWARMEPELSRAQQQLSAACVGLHIAFALALNFLFVAPVLRRFEPEYAATMRAAAGELADRVGSGTNRRVLVEADIGVLSCAAEGRFLIYDGGALATPALRGLSVRDQIAEVDPAFVVESLAVTPSGFGASYRDLLAEVWQRRFRQHSVRRAEPYYYAIIYRNEADGSGIEAGAPGAPTASAGLHAAAGGLQIPSPAALPLAPAPTPAPAPAPSATHFAAVLATEARPSSEQK